MKTALRVLGVAAAIVVVLFAAGAGFVYSGRYNVAATHGHTKPVEQVFRSMMLRSVTTHARDIHPPANFNAHDRELAEHAAGHYEAMCRTCHGAPGRKPDAWQLYPPPPDLADALRVMHWSDAEVYWIIRNGLKDSGMSAFGGSHDDDDLWALTAFVRQLSSISADEYQAMVKQHPVNEHMGMTEEHGNAPKSDTAHHH